MCRLSSESNKYFKTTHTILLKESGRIFDAPVFRLLQCCLRCSTEPQHSQSVTFSRSLLGPFVEVETLFWHSIIGKLIFVRRGSTMFHEKDMMCLTVVVSEILGQSTASIVHFLLLSFLDPSVLVQFVYSFSLAQIAPTTRILFAPSVSPASLGLECFDTPSVP